MAGNVNYDGTYNYTFDAEGKILTMNGNGVSASYVYDALGNRVRVETSSAINEYLYDYAGRRTSTWLNPSLGDVGAGDEGRIYWDGQQIAYRAENGTTYFDHQNWLGTERVRTSYNGAVAATFTSLPWSDGSSQTVGGEGADQEDLSFAGLNLDLDGAQNATFRTYSSAEGRWLAPDPYDGSYDFTNRQSFNRYAYVLNNPLSFTDPTGQDGGAGATLCAAGPIPCVAGLGIEALADWLLSGLFEGPSFHGTLKPRASTGDPSWDGNFGESLGIGSNLETGTWGIATALGIPDAGCEFAVTVCVARISGTTHF